MPALLLLESDSHRLCPHAVERCRAAAASLPSALPSSPAADPEECVSGILISFTNDAPVSAGATDLSGIPSVPVYVPPTASPSPSPSAPVVTTPSPSPTTASPTPAAGAPSPAPAAPAIPPPPATYYTLSITVRGSTAAAAIAKCPRISAGIAALLSLPDPSWVQCSASAARRRLQAAGDVSLLLTIYSTNPTADAARLRAASAGLDSLMKALGVSVDVSQGLMLSFPTSASPAPAGAIPAPAPAAPVATADGGSNNGAIIGELESFGWA